MSKLDKEHPWRKKGSTIFLCCKSLNKSLLTPAGSLKPSSVLPRATSSQVWFIRKVVSNHRHLCHQHLIEDRGERSNWGRHFSSRSKVSSSSAGQFDIIGSPPINLAVSVQTPNSSPRACVQSHGGRMLDLRETRFCPSSSESPCMEKTLFWFVFQKDGRQKENKGGKPLSSPQQHAGDYLFSHRCTEPWPECEIAAS